jgi:hypothetical protein
MVEAVCLSGEGTLSSVSNFYGAQRLSVLCHNYSSSLHRTQNDIIHDTSNPILATFSMEAEQDFCRYHYYRTEHTISPNERLDHR